MNYITVKTTTINSITIEMDGWFIKLTRNNWASIDICTQPTFENYRVKILSNTGTEIHFTTEDDILIEDIRMLTGLGCK